MAEKITYGIQNVYYAVMSGEGTTASPFSYASPVALPGASEISLSTVGETTKIFADNIVYDQSTTNQGYEGNLNLYAIPDSFYTAVLGQTKDSNDAIVEKSTDTGVHFALLFEFLTESAKTKRVVMYNCVAGRPQISSKTKETSVNAEAVSIPITAAPRTDNYKVKASLVGDSADTTWSGWFTSVYE